MNNLYRKLLCNISGSVVILAAAMLPLLMICMGITIDAGRYYVAQAKAQTASDAALLGAVATSSTTDVHREMKALLAANFPHQYMGSTLGEVQVRQLNGSTYESHFTLDVPMMVMRLFGTESAHLDIVSQVVKGFDVDRQRRLELALVLDNSSSMYSYKIDQLKLAAHDLTDILFGDSPTLQNVHISFLPYDVDINIGPGRVSWVQPEYQEIYLQQDPYGKGFISNRNRDDPPNDFTDLSDDPPLTEDKKFRTPYGAPHGGCGDQFSGYLPLMRFALNQKADIHAAIDTMVPAGCTRINVGLMWGWFTLSPKWQNVWDTQRPTLPQDPEDLLDKAIVLMTDGRNSVFTGQWGTSNDDQTTELMCSLIKSQGITIYTIGLGTTGEISEPLLQACASQPNYYFHAPTADDLRTVFRKIADDITYQTIRLSR